MLLNLDKLERTATLHTDSSSRLPAPLGTQLEPMGRLGRDGGWFRVESRAEAESTVARERPVATLIRCSFC